MQQYEHLKEIDIKAFQKKYKREYEWILVQMRIENLSKEMLIMSDINFISLFEIKGNPYYIFMNKVEEIYSLENYLNNEVTKEQNRYDITVGRFTSGNATDVLHFLYAPHGTEVNIYQMFEDKPEKVFNLVLLFLFKLNKILINVSGITLHMDADEQVLDLLKKDGYTIYEEKPVLSVFKKSFQV